MDGPHRNVIIGGAIFLLLGWLFRRQELFIKIPPQVVGWVAVQITG